VVETDRPRTIEYSAEIVRLARRITKTKKKHTHSLRICNIAFSTVTIVTRTRFDVTLYAYCLSCYVHNFGFLAPYSPSFMIPNFETYVVQNERVMEYFIAHVGQAASQAWHS